MIDVDAVKESVPDLCFLNTGSPHHVQMVDDLENYNIKENEYYSLRRFIRKAGSNINFVKQIDQTTMRTPYERGVG
jgi:diaminopimelate epimerase